jgi:hypothetical protein
MSEAIWNWWTDVGKLLFNISPLTYLLILYCDEAADKADFNKLVVVFIWI